MSYNREAGAGAAVRKGIPTGKAVRSMDEDKLLPESAQTIEEAQPSPRESIEAVQGEAEEAQEALTGQVEEASPGPEDYMSDWGRRANALSEKAWKICQILMGATMGLICAACLLFFQSDGFLPVNFIIAFLLAKFGPDFVEKWFERDASTSRVALLAALAAALVLYIVYGLLTHQFG